MVDRCVCSDKSFSDLKNIIEKNKLTSFDELSGFTEFGEGCKSCIPYIELIFKTGLTSFDLINIQT
jgi:NAD(P)H-nitrite reductase large subunit